MSETMFTFDAWRGYLEFDAEQVAIREKVWMLLSDAVLESLWRAGVEPTVAGVIEFCESPAPKLCAECRNPASKGSKFCAVHLRLYRAAS